MNEPKKNKKREEWSRRKKKCAVPSSEIAYVICWENLENVGEWRKRKKKEWCFSYALFGKMPAYVSCMHSPFSHFFFSSVPFSHNISLSEEVAKRKRQIKNALHKRKKKSTSKMKWECISKCGTKTEKKKANGLNRAKAHTHCME